MKLVRGILPLTHSTLARSRNLPSLVLGAFSLAAVALLCLLPAYQASSADCAPPPSGIISWWQAEGNARDLAGTNNGVLVSGATFAPGKVGQAFSFDGVRSHVQVPDNPNLRFTDAMTMEAWLYPTSLGVHHEVISKWDWTYPNSQKC